MSEQCHKNCCKASTEIFHCYLLAADLRQFIGFPEKTTKIILILLLLVLCASLVFNSQCNTPFGVNVLVKLVNRYFYCMVQ